MRNFDWDKKKKRFWTKRTKTLAQRQVPNCIGSPFSGANHVLNGVCCRIEIDMHRRPVIDEVFRCASISCTDDRISHSLIETGDRQFCMFDNYFTIRLVQSKV